jgi:hypothetical protein
VQKRGVTQHPARVQFGLDQRGFVHVEFDLSEQGANYLVALYSDLFAPFRLEPKRFLNKDQRLSCEVVDTHSIEGYVRIIV